MGEREREREKRKERKEDKYSERSYWVRSFCTLFTLHTRQSTRIFWLCSMQHVRNTHTWTHTLTLGHSEAGTHNLSVECVILYFRRSKFSYDNIGSRRRQGRASSPALRFARLSSVSAAKVQQQSQSLSLLASPSLSTLSHTIPAIIFISKKIKHKTETAHFTISSSIELRPLGPPDRRKHVRTSLFVFVFVCVYLSFCVFCCNLDAYYLIYLLLI